MRAFSLVELSIVLVILGLLTGGILAGQSLIRAAELRSIPTQSATYLTSIHIFRDTYMATPGDMPNATQFWGKNNDACPTHPGATAANGVCNGNGDGKVSLYSAGNAGDPQEAFQFWMHLARAGLIEGSYTGLAGPNGWADSIAGMNAPAMRIANGIWGARYMNTGIMPTHFALGEIGNHLSFGARDGNGWPQVQILRPPEAWNIDRKLDDGKPARGRVFTSQWSNCSTATDRNSLDADYNLENNTIVCGLWMVW